MALDGKAAVTISTRGWSIRALSFLLALLITTPGVVQAQDGESKVKSIQIRGAKRIEETVRLAAENLRANHWRQ